MSTEPPLPPFAWQDKRVLRRIREHVQDYASAIAVYVALTVVESDNGSNDEFQTTHSWLAQMSGLGERTVRSRIHDLVAAGVIAVTTPKLRAPCTYRLLPFGNGSRTNGNGCRAFGKVFVRPLPGSEVSKLGREATPSRKPLRDVERIGLENKLKGLRQKLQRLKEDTSEPWQVREYPERLDELHAVEREIAEVEAQL